MSWKQRGTILAFAMGISCLGARPALANHISTATVTPSCTGYTIAVTGGDLSSDTYNVQYSITLGLTSSTGLQTFTGTIPVIKISGSFSDSLTVMPYPPPGLPSGTYTFFAGTATLYDVTDSTSWNTISTSDSPPDFTFGVASLACSAPPPPGCTTGLQPITYNLQENGNNASEIVWFNSHFKLQGPLPASTFTVTVTNGSIQFGTSTLTVPNGVITFSSTATCASTTFSGGAWATTIPLSAASHADEIFAAGLAYVLPAGFAQNVHGVTWTADFESSAPSLQIQWQWGAANYLSSNNKGDVFPMIGGAIEYVDMDVLPGHNVTVCGLPNTGGDHAGTPENAEVKALVVGGGSGGGGSNWTGSWSSTDSPVCK